MDRAIATSIRQLAAVLVAATLPVATALAQDGEAYEIIELSAGRVADATEQYVVFRVQDTGHLQSLPGLWLRTEDAQGNIGTFAQIEGDGHDDPRYYVAATVSAVTYYGIEADFVATGPALSADAGRICLMTFDFPATCVPYGDFQGDAEFGPPAPALPLGQALSRGGFTGDPSEDFDLVDPDPAAWVGGGNGETGNGETGNGETGNGETGNGESGNGETGNGETGNGETGNGETGNGETGNGETGNGGTGGGPGGAPGGDLPPNGCDCQAAGGGGPTLAFLLLAGMVWALRQRGRRCRVSMPLP